jgi:predicted transcriptional regulator
MGKEVTIYCRVSAEMKRKLAAAADARDEAEAVIVREALNEYFERKERARGDTLLRSIGKYPRPKPGPLELNEPQ